MTPSQGPGGRLAPDQSGAIDSSSGTIKDYLDIKSTSPDVGNAIAYLRSLGLSPNVRITFADEALDDHNAHRWNNSTVTFTDEAGRTATVIAGALALAPNEAAATLAFHGLFPGLVLPAALSLAPYQVDAMHRASTPVGFPIPVPVSPIGAPMTPGATSVGANFYDNTPTWPNGAPWSDATGSYQHVVGQQVRLFGPYTSWTRIK